MKKTMMVSVLLTITLISLLFVASCAKKQLKVAEEAPTVTPAPKEAEKAPPAAIDEEGARKAEEERVAKLRELEAAQTMRGQLQAFESQYIYFDFDKSDLKPEARAILEKKASWLKANPQHKVRIEGHCDERGTNE